jgi:LuxR family maltose regulon positive regulatory protein
VRHRLVRLIDSVESGRVVAISAPAGWGKSELLDSWDQHRQFVAPTAWITLEQRDSHPHRFWHRFLAAVAEADWSGREAFRRLDLAPSDGDLEGEQIVRAIVDRVPADATTLVIVLDDVHLLAGQDSIEALSVLLRNCPPAWRFVLSGRSLPLPLMRLRVAGLLTCLTHRELAFDVAEATDLLKSAGCRLQPSEVAEMVACTGGWAAGLRLAVLPLARGVPVADVLTGVRSGRHDVERYFDEEVVGALDPDIADFLASTCVSPTLDERLARHLSGREDAGALLRSLTESGIFTAPDRELADTYRYHPLLAESLERLLATTEPERRRELHRAAAQWHEDHRAPDVAFAHSVASEDWSRCVRLIDTMWIPMFVRGDVDGLADLLAVLPTSLVTRNNVLTSLQALVHLDQADTARIAGSMSITSSASRAEMVLVLESSRRAGFDDVARRVSAQLLSQLPSGDPTDAVLRTYVLLSRGVAEYWASDLAASERDLQRALEEAEREGLDYIRMGCLSQLVGVFTAQNRVNDGEALAAVASELAIERGWEGSGWAAELWHALGWISYLRCDVSAAKNYLDRAERSVWRQDAVVGAIIPTIAALVARLSHDGAEARALLDLASARLPVERERYIFLSYIDAERARWAVHDGELGRARSMLRGNLAERSLHHSVAMAELHIAERNPDLAARTLRRGLNHGRGFLDQRLHAMALLASIETPDTARTILVEAMQLAAPERIIQPFCQVGSSIQPMIGGIGRSRRALRTFAAEIREQFRELNDDMPAAAASVPGGLTARELDVIRLLDGHDTLAEIAERLHVSRNTLKVHTRHLYEKLSVSSRRDALEEATRRGLL